jgi:hypothetical protein
MGIVRKLDVEIIGKRSDMETLYEVTYFTADNKKVIMYLRLGKDPKQLDKRFYKPISEKEYKARLKKKGKK